MLKKWMVWVNYTAGAILALLLLAAAWFWLTRPEDYVVDEHAVIKNAPPKRAFEREEESYHAIGAPVFSLNYSPLGMQTPDLKRYLVYYGRNSRPDAQIASTLLFFGFTGNKSPTSVLPGERLYVLYDKSQTPPQYIFSPDNAKTPLWVEATVSGNQAHVKVGIDKEPSDDAKGSAGYVEFNIPEKEFVRAGTVWEIGKWRVDGTLLARQKARWYGIDRFLERHGGEEFEGFIGKQRIDFGEGEEAYSVYVAMGDCMIWKDEKWQVVQAGEDSLHYPMMCIKKIDERLMTLELWDVSGKGKITLNLLKVNEAWVPQNIQQSFKFLASRTRSQFVFELNKERITLRPRDWLVLTSSGWKKLSTPEEIDSFVGRQVIGPLFIFDGVERKDDRQVLKGTLFNTARTEMQSIEIPLQQGGNVSGPPGSDERDVDKLQKNREGNTPHVINNRNEKIEPGKGYQVPPAGG
jgi:hypothetical protein